MKRWWRASGLIALLMLAACGSRQDPLILAGNPWLGYQPLFWVEQQGFFRGKSIQLREMSSSMDTMQAFRRGEVHAAALTLDEALLLAEYGVPMCIPLVMSFSNGADSLLVRDGIMTLTDLKGKRVGVENTAVGAHMLARVLELGGLTLSDITVVPRAVEQHHDAFLGNEVDALITFEPLRSQLMRQGARELFSSAEIPDEITDLLVLNPRYLAQHPERVATLLAGWFKGLETLHDADHEAMHHWLAQRSGLSPDEVRTGLTLLSFHSLEDNQQILLNPDHSFRRVVRQVNERMLKRRVINTRLPIDSLFCSPAVLSLYPAKGTV